MALRMVTLLAGTLAVGMVALNIFGLQRQPVRTFEDLRDQIIYNTQRLDTLERDVMQLRRLDTAADIRVLQSDITSIHERLDNLETHLDAAIYTGFGILSLGLSLLGFLIRRWILSVQQTHDHNHERENL